MPDYDYDEFDDYDESDNFDNYKYEDYDDDDDYSLTDDTPLTSTRSDSLDYDDAPLERTNYSDRTRSPSRRETIQRVAEEQQSGTSRKPGVAPPDSRLGAPYGGRRPGDRQRPNRNRSERVYSERAYSERNRGNPPPNKHKTKFAAFYIVLLLIAVGVCLTVLLVVLENMEGAFVRAPLIGSSSTTASGTEPDPDPFIRADMRNQTALITNIGSFGEMHTLTLMDINTRRTQDFTATDEARISDRLGRPLTFSELSVGTIVDIGYDSRNNNIAVLSENRQSFERARRTNVQIDLNEFEITLGNETWAFNAQTLVLYRGEPFSISLIDPIDVVTLVGQGDTIWRVQVETAHGFLQINNADMITNGSIMIGSNIIHELDEMLGEPGLPDGTFRVLEGPHRVMVEGENIETFIENVDIVQGQTTRLNMGEAPLRAALLHIIVSPEDAQVFVNGEEHDNTGPAHVEFGENIIRVERDGFIPQEQTIDIIAPISSIPFELVEIHHDNTLVILTTPTNAEIYIDNLFVGHSSHTHTLPTGTFTIIARMEGHDDTTISVTITGDETEAIMRHLILLPNTGDSFQTMPLPDVDPIPPEGFPTPTPTPLPTLPPTTNNDSPPPGGPGTDIVDDGLWVPVTPSPSPGGVVDDGLWWAVPPSP
ncbi:MAG: PEGA domain-containing protein [Defluviitaleaceae bacterium]|nr:PEGA domain-containing protein [Defluviitaleaceae bacterium]